jgi:outer membrane receptor protein involved in Fe transport
MTRAEEDQASAANSGRSVSRYAIGLAVAVAGAGLLMAVPAGLVAESAVVLRQVPRDSLSQDSVFRVDPIEVTATRTARPVFTTPAPVSVIDRSMLRRAKPNTVTDLFRDLAGLDVNGVGVQQPRPVIRGQRGQRILLLSDGLRLNNSRRQQDFGEIPSLVSPAQVERVEIVRGPASVLYGTDAIGGVVNIITQRPTQAGIHGTVGYLFGAEEDQHRGTVSLFALDGAFDWQVTGSWREAGNYRAPDGEFGAIVLNSPTVVNATGIKDWNAAFRAGWSVSDRHSVWGRVERYESEDAGFGFVEPDAYAADQPRIDIAYPMQEFTRVTGGWSATRLALPVADRFELMAYRQENRRELTFDLFTGFGPMAPPGAGISIDQYNYSDLGTNGLRLEVKKLAAGGLLFTYGLDWFRDASANRDSSVTTIVGFGPPQTEISTDEQVPDASYRSLGGFAQGEYTAGRLTVIAGARYQTVRAEAEEGQGVPAGLTSKSARTLVGSANLLYALSDEWSLVGSVGRAFRAPNMIEWFFEGPTPEGSGFQVRSPDLEPETSVNVDAGIRYRGRRIAAELFVYRNSVRDGIRIAPTGDTIQGFPAYQNVNLDKLLFRGAELSAEALVTGGLSVAGSYTWSDSEDELDPSNPIGDTFASKVTGALRYRDPGSRYWAEYRVRHNGERKDVTLSDNPLGDVLPSFTVHAVRGGVSLPRFGAATPSFGISVENLTNTLYAEFTNASFFRPEPRRRVTLSMDVSF